HAHCAVGRVKASVASGLVRRAEIFGHVLDDNGLGLWACPDATLASPHAALAAHRARLDRSGTVLVVRVVGVAALAVADRLREAVGPLLRHALDLVFGHAVTQRGAVASHHDVVGHRFPSVSRFGGSVVRGYAVWGCEADRKSVV